jgi:hypothetical protein
VTNSCAVPANRGADPLDRDSWEGAFQFDDGQCDSMFDFALEEVLHLVTTAGASDIYKETWGESFNSEVGSQLEMLNGNCGWGWF